MRIAAILCLLLTGACSNPREGQLSADEQIVLPDSERVAQGPVETGAMVLAEEGFQRLAGKRVGLIVNHTALVDTVHLIDLMHQAPGVEVAALFGPEHGLRGEAGAGETIKDGNDVATGAPIFSLYGDTRKPTPEMLEHVDVLVFDIQDVGARFYTYISTLGLAMQSAAEVGIPFIVLDRPNPLGGQEVAGWVLDPRHTSFVGQYPIPIVHGMTVGELARMIQGEALLPGLDALQLDVVQAEGWQRAMLWPETGLPWIPPSPNVPDFETALVYPGAAFFEATSASEGRGTRTPFKQLGATWADGERLAADLNQLHLPGVRFEATTFTPESIPGMAPNPKLEGKSVHGIRYQITDPDAFDPVATGVHILHAFYHNAPAGQRDAFLNRPEWLAKLSGVDAFYEMLSGGASPEEIIATWEDDVEAFQQRRAPYLLYE